MKRPAIIILVLSTAAVLAYLLFLNQNRTAINNGIPTMNITSPAFRDGETIPREYTCEGLNRNPELRIGNVPTRAVSLALIVDDPDAPKGTFTHWTIWNIDPKTVVIPENSVPPGGVQGQTGTGEAGYVGPCPPPGTPHHYHLKLYALDSLLGLPAGTPKQELEEEIKKHLIARTELVGIYKR